MDPTREIRGFPPVCKQNPVPSTCIINPSAYVWLKQREANLERKNSTHSAFWTAKITSIRQNHRGPMARSRHGVAILALLLLLNGKLMDLPFTTGGRLGNFGMILEKNLRSLEKKFTFPGKNIYSPWKRNLGSCGPVVLWLFGPLVLWLFGPVVLWSCGPLVLCSSGPLVLWSTGPVVLWSCGRVVLWSSGPKILCTASESRSMFCECIWGGGAAPSPPTPLQPGSG